MDIFEVPVTEKSTPVFINNRPVGFYRLNETMYKNTVGPNAKFYQYEGNLHSISSGKKVMDLAEDIHYFNFSPDGSKLSAVVGDRTFKGYATSDQHVDFPSNPLSKLIIYDVGSKKVIKEFNLTDNMKKYTLPVWVSNYEIVISVIDRIYSRNSTDNLYYYDITNNKNKIVAYYELFQNAKYLTSYNSVKKYLITYGSAYENGYHGVTDLESIVSFGLHGASDIDRFEGEPKMIISDKYFLKRGYDNYFLVDFQKNKPFKESEVMYIGQEGGYAKEKIKILAKKISELASGNLTSTEAYDFIVADIKSNCEKCVVD